MEIEIVEAPIQFQLHGNANAVENNCFGAVGMGLMNEMWWIVEESNPATTGINRWVYPPDGRMFVVVELSPGSPSPEHSNPMRLN